MSEQETTDLGTPRELLLTLLIVLMREGLELMEAYAIDSENWPRLYMDLRARIAQVLTPDEEELAAVKRWAA